MRHNVGHRKLGRLTEHRIALLRKGRLVQAGPVTEVYDRPVDLDAARFFSPLGEIAAKVVNGAAETPLGIVPAAGFAVGSGRSCARNGSSLYRAVPVPPSVHRR